jgi:hypothetical protein
MDTYSLKFLPYLRQGLGANARISDTDKFHRIKDVKVNLVNQEQQPIRDQTGNEITSKHTTTLIGPADIVGFYPRSVARTMPDHNTNDFEHNYFPFIEFKAPDFPWRYTLGDPDDKNCLNPWIMLLVLTEDEIEKRERIRLTRKSYIEKIVLNDKGKKHLPDPQKAWAWGHVQYSGGEPIDNEDALSKSLIDHPEWNCSRILCTRKLERLTKYYAFVVPWYEAGRLAGLRLENKDKNDSCWQNTGINELPIYYQWSFQTSEIGDFEDLVTKINAEECPTGVGSRSINGACPGFPLPDVDYGSFELEGALLPLEKGEPGPTLETENTFSDEVSELISKITFMEDPGDEEDPFVTIPYYGQYYRDVKKDSLKEANWRKEINLDRRYRVPAGMGTKVVQKNQEEYMHLCWSQVKDVRAANEELRRAAAGVLISERLKERHLDPLSTERFLTISEPFHHYIKNTSTSLKSQIAAAGTPQGLMSYPMRRIFAQKTRFANSKFEDRKAYSEYIQKTYSEYIQSSIYHNKNIAGQPAKTQRAKKEFYSASPLLGDKVTFLPLIELDKIRRKFCYPEDVLNRLKDLITITKRQDDDEFKIEQRMCSPELPFAMYAYLKELSPEYLIPNLKELKNNTVILGLENRKFIEAYMVGLNHEMSRELVWREYPTDRKGTLFIYFWEPADEKQLLRGDIKEVFDWKDKNGNDTKLGENASNEGDVEERTIFAVKADLIRRYSNAVFYLVETQIENPSKDEWESFFNNFDNENRDPKYKIIEPQITATVSNDIRLWGFPIKKEQIEDNPAKYFFIIEEIPSLPRFGLDIGKADLVSRFDDLSWDDFRRDDSDWLDPTLPISVTIQGETEKWNQFNTGALVAKFFLQSPVLKVFPAMKMIPPKKKY